MARYLEENFDFDKEDWASVSISFFYDINEEAPKLHRYISIEGEQKVKLSNLSSSGIEERAENCLITEVHYSEDPDVMIQPVIDYARENGLRLEGTFYGRGGYQLFHRREARRAVQGVRAYHKKIIFDKKVLTSELLRGLCFF